MMNILCTEILVSLYPMFEDISSRYQTFNDYEWPNELQNYALKLAQFGFFYKGNNLTVICHACGVCVKDWKLDLNNCPLSLDTEIKIQHIKKSIRCKLIIPLYRDEAFYTQFMLHDVEYHSTELRNFLAQVGGVNSEKYKSYFTERGIVAADVAAAAAAGCGAGTAAADKSEPDESLDPLEITNKKLQPSSQNLCGICYTNERNILTHPCCHLFICISCYKKDSTNKKIIKCTYCREKIAGYSIVYQP